MLILVWFERSHSAQVNGQMTLKAVGRTWICTCGYGRLRGEWINVVINTVVHTISLQIQK